MFDRWPLAAPGAAWRARKNPGYAADVLRHAACATCSLGSRGLRDDVRPGLHLCRRRLEDLPRVVADPMDEGALARADLLDRPALRRLGRLSAPMLRRRGGRFEAIGWEDAAHLLATRLEGARGAWTLHVGDEELGNEDAWALATLASTLEAAGVTRRGAVRPRWQRCLLATTGFGGSPSSLADLPTAERVVIWGDVLRSHPELVRWLPRRGEVLTVGCHLPGHRRLPGTPLELAERGRAASWRRRPSELRVGREPTAVPEPALAEPALHLVDAALLPEPFVGLALLQGALARPGAGLVVLGGQPGVSDMGLHGDGDAPTADVEVHVGDARRRPSTAGFRAHLGWFADPAMMIEPAGEVLVLPLRWRFEAEGGTTTTSADRVVRFSPQVLGHDVAGALSLPSALAPALGLADAGGPAIRRAIAAAVPHHGPIADLQRPGASFQWGGAQPLAEGFPTDDGRARVP
jgi:hypothetical protein